MTTAPLPRTGIGSTTVQEVRLLKTKDYGWRWDVTDFRTAQTHHSGVYDGRIHLGSEFGYARTRRGALRAIAKALHTEQAR